MPMIFLSSRPSSSSTISSTSKKRSRLPQSKLRQTRHPPPFRIVVQREQPQHGGARWGRHSSDANWGHWASGSTPTSHTVGNGSSRQAGAVSRICEASQANLSLGLCIRRGGRCAAPKIIQHEKTDRRRQIALLAVVVDLAHQLGQRHVPNSRDFLHAVPECLFEADAGLVTR